ncbi:MAG: M28 family peptidase [Bacteroidota bacterium]
MDKFNVRKEITALRVLFIYLFSSFIGPSVFAQENKGEVYQYARNIVDTMASKSMHGRGYVNDGDKIAANYIRSEFKKLGLKPFKDDYYQPFTFSINTFPDKLELNFNLSDKSNKNFNFTGIAGKNYLVEPSSPGISADYSLDVFDSTNALCNRTFRKFVRRTVKNQFILIDDRGVTDKKKLAYFSKIRLNPSSVAGTIEVVKKLTWSQSQTVSSFVKIRILADSFNYNGYRKAEGGGGIVIENKFIPNYQSQNIIGYVKGSEHPDSFIVFSAHYDHLGQMGKDAYFPGANDNASGCAMLLNLAKYYSLPQNQPKYSVAFIAFGAEEVGLLGSKHYTESPLFPLNSIRFLLNMDIMGTGEDGITVVNGSVFKEEFDNLVKINVKNKFIKDVKIRGKAANSDHYFFSEKGVKAFFIYTMGGINAYHDIYDRAETLPLNEFEDLFKLINRFSTYLQN